MLPDSWDVCWRDCGKKVRYYISFGPAHKSTFWPGVSPSLGTLVESPLHFIPQVYLLHDTKLPIAKYANSLYPQAAKTLILRHWKSAEPPMVEKQSQSRPRAVS